SYPLVPLCRACWRERNDLLFEQIQRSVNRSCEFDPRTWPLFFVPSSGFDGLVGGLFEDSYSSHYRGLSRSLNRRVSSSRSISFAVPESMVRKRRTISLSHSLAASESAGASRVFTRS